MVIILLSFIDSITLTAQPVHIQRIMRQVELAQPGMLYGMLQLFILKLRHLAALRANKMMVSITVITFFILGRIAELMFNYQAGIDQKNDGIVQGSPTDAEVFLIGHQRIERVNIKVPFNGIDGFEYSVAFGSLAMPVRIQIFRQYLLHRIFHILTIHIRYPG